MEYLRLCAVVSVDNKTQVEFGFEGRTRGSMVSYQRGASSLAPTGAAFDLLWPCL